MTSPNGSSRSVRGKRIVVTGSTRGLGYAFARSLLEGGASVVINGRTVEACEVAIADLKGLGGDVAYSAGPIEADGVSEALIQTCVDTFGAVDLVINNAGIVRDRTLMKMTHAEFDEVIAVHLRGTWSTAKAAAIAMAGNGGGAIVNVVSGSALFGLIGQCNYAAAKGGILGLTRALSVELAHHRIRVNAVYPSAATDMTSKLIELGSNSSSVPGMGFGPPEDVAPLMVFLASDAAAHMTGQLVAFDGRQLAVWTHPQQNFLMERPGPWSVGDVDAALNRRPSPLTQLNPDRWGVAARDATAASLASASRP
jgi:3-oxoacyl-[acyl-carrier protein] reductase